MSENRSDSSSTQTDILREALMEIVPPVSLEKKELSFWNKIVKARHTWSDIDLVHAANLARTLCSIEEETFFLKIEGSVVENLKGTRVMNPRHTVLEQLSRRSVAISTKLHVHAAATLGDPKDNRKKNDKKNEMLNVVNDDDDGLIATPSIH